MVVRWLALLMLVLEGAIAARNTVIGVNTGCSQDEVKVSLLFSEEFKGVVFAKGFPRQCNATLQTDTVPNDRITLRIDPKHCGIRITKSQETGKLTMSGVVQVQMSASLQQVDDPSIPIYCNLDEDMFLLPTKKPLSSRTGRRMSKVGKAWMEVRGSAISTLSPTQTLSVGEHTTLAIYTSLPEGVGSAPIECSVHDGHGTRQWLSDERGCPLEPSLVPRLNYDPKTQSWAAAFPAFSFPDYQLVHYTCLLRLCHHTCPQVDCEAESNNSRNSRDYQEDDKSIMEVVELYNSVEVTAPNIELGYLKREITEPTQESEREGEVCVAGPRLAVMLAGLGLLFVLGVLASLGLLLRHKTSRPLPVDRRLLVLRNNSPPLSLWTI